MLFDVYVKFGFGVTQHRLDPISISQDDVDNVGEFAGSYHVLEMGGHYRDYVERGDMPEFPPIVGFPQNIHYEPLTNKQRSQGVTGNIGEAVAGIVATRILGIPETGVAHIRLQRPFRKRQCPDFLLQVRGNFSAPICDFSPLRHITHFPEWWPAEAKARVDSNGCDDAARDAFRQLGAYWYTIATGMAKDDVGYGLIVTCAYDRNKGICIRIILPRDKDGLIHHLTGFQSYDEFLEKTVEDDSILRSYIHAS